MRPLPRNERRRPPPGGSAAPSLSPSPERRQRRPAARVAAVWVPPVTPTPPPVAVATAAGGLAGRKLGRAPSAPATTRASLSSVPARSRPRQRALGLVAVIVALAVVAVVAVRRSGAVARVASAAPSLESLAPLAGAAEAVRSLDVPRLEAPAATAEPTAVAPPIEAPVPPVPLGDRADARVRYAGYETIRGGVLYLPRTFSSADGAYDLVLHFHGNVKVVVESAEVADLNAVTAIVNLGIGSARYQDAYAEPGTYEGLLNDIQRAVGARGVAHPHLRRVALSGWSAGYGAISTILEVRRGKDPLDAILMLDGIHCGWLDDKHEALNFRQLAPFVRAAKDAAAGRILFTVTHSEIDPLAYASSNATSTYLLKSLGGALSLSDSAPPHMHLRSLEGAIVKRLEKWMEPTTEGSIGDFHVRGFRGETAEHHMAHLFQMGATVLPELKQRWAAQAPDPQAVRGIRR